MASICQWMNTLKGKDLLILSLPNVAKGKFRPSFQNLIFQKCEKQIASCESTGRVLSFEWSHHRISSTDSNVRVTLQNSIKHSSSERVKAFVEWLDCNCRRLLTSYTLLRTERNGLGRNWSSLAIDVFFRQSDSAAALEQARSTRWRLGWINPPRFLFPYARSTICR